MLTLPLPSVVKSSGTMATSSGKSAQLVKKPFSASKLSNGSLYRPRASYSSKICRVASEKVDGSSGTCGPTARGRRAYAQRVDQLCEGGGQMLNPWTNRAREEGKCSMRGPTVRGKRAYAQRADQLREEGGHMLNAWTSRMREEGICSTRGPTA
eukprot:1186834-Prorocentrum_minimum.AAC.6